MNYIKNINYSKVWTLIKKIWLVLFLLSWLIIGYYAYPKIELTKVTLKCISKVPSKDNQSEEIENYYKITKHLFNDNPYKLYWAYPRITTESVSPYLDGYWVKSKESEYSRDYGSVSKDISKYFFPDWYTFIQLENENGIFKQKDIFFAFNRESLNLVTHFFDLPTFDAKCEVVNNKEFDKKYQELLNKEIGKKKI